MCLTQKRGVYKKSLSGEQERWWSQASNKPQKFEQLSAIPLFQDGGPTLSNGLIAVERLHEQNRLEGCLLLHSTSQKSSSDIYTFSMGRELV